MLNLVLMILTMSPMLWMLQNPSTRLSLVSPFGFKELTSNRVGLGSPIQSTEYDDAENVLSKHLPGDRCSEFTVHPLSAS